MSHFCYIPKKRCRTLRTVECFVKSCMQNLHISTFRPVYRKIFQEEGFERGRVDLDKAWALLAEGLITSASGAAGHLLSNCWSVLATGWQLKGWITVILSLTECLLGPNYLSLLLLKNQTLIYVFLIFTLTSSRPPLAPCLFCICNFGSWGWENIKCIGCLFLEASLYLGVHFVENVETFISKNCWQWSFSL